MYSTWATCGDTGVEHLTGRISGIDPKYDLKQLQYNYFQQISLKYLFCPFGKKIIKEKLLNRQHVGTLRVLTG